jgi:hemerythrin-like domain-containing protein
MVQRFGRRTFATGAAALSAAALASGCAGDRELTMAVRSHATLAPRHEHEEAEVSAAEDLMREHGVLERALLVYEAALRRGATASVVPLRVVADTAGLLRRFVKDYHEKLEEEFVFPRLVEAGRHVELVGILRTQHDRGRMLTDDILAIARKGGGEATASGRLGDSIRSYVRMYRPHAAREDTVVFPALREVVQGKAYDALGEQFERREHALFGAGGFRTIVAEVEELERTVGIDDLATFTPEN